MQNNSMAISHPRRTFLCGSSLTMLSTGAVMLLAGRPLLAAQSQGDAAADAGILNVALALEHQGISAYTLGAQSGLLQKPVLDIALKFQADHKVHRDLLIGAIHKLGGQPAEAKSLDAYAKALNAGQLKNQADVLKLSLSLELGASNAYLSVIPAFKDHAYASVAGRLAADEVAHWAVLNNALGLPLPKAMMFGA